MRDEASRGPKATGFRRLVQDAPVALDLEASDVRGAVEQLISKLVERHSLTAEQGERLLGAVMQRETDQSSALGDGVVLPHGFLDELDGPRLAVARLAQPLDLGAPDGVPSQFVFLLCGGRADRDAGATRSSVEASEGGPRPQDYRLRAQQEQGHEHDEGHDADDWVRLCAVDG